MMVLDASSAVALVLPDQSSNVTLTGADVQGAMAPSIWPYEVVSALRVAEMRGRIDAADVDLAVSLFSSFDIEFVHPRTDEVLALARETGLTVYDASYLAVAIRYERPLATSDHILIAAARKLGIRVYT